ncbi:MAG: FAD-dependent oxidoreductase [Armatimonadetes bacterium]|nr:MAG: FAD-dependent oxidoreductase [Armatimonadota bacterium]
MSKRVVVIGGGWSGAAAAHAAYMAGADSVVLVERTDYLLGTGLVGGIMRNNGRFTAAEEMIAMGGGLMFEICDEVSIHKNFDFPGHKHASLYDVTAIEPAVNKALVEEGIEVKLIHRVTKINISDGSINSIHMENGTVIEGDVFIDTTGTVGPQKNCTRYGSGCVMCIVRCPTFGPRTSISGLAGAVDRNGFRKDGEIGVMSGSCKLSKDSLSPELSRKLSETGIVMVPFPEKTAEKMYSKLGAKACQQYALPEYADNIILLDTGQAKMMTSYVDLDDLRTIPGFEQARYEDPYSGSLGNSIRYLDVTTRDNTMKVECDVDNLYCGGEKAGLLVGHTEAIVTGTLAGHNAVRQLAGRAPIEIPHDLATGDAISHVRSEMDKPGGMSQKYTFSGSVFFERMKERNRYTTDIDLIQKRVESTGLNDVFSRSVV